MWVGTCKQKSKKGCEYVGMMGCGVGSVVCAYLCLYFLAEVIVCAIVIIVHSCLLGTHMGT